MLPAAQVLPVHLPGRQPQQAASGTGVPEDDGEAHLSTPVLY